MIKTCFVCLELGGGIFGLSPSPVSRLKLIRQVANIEAGIFSIDYPVPPRGLSNTSVVTAFVFMVESNGIRRYLTLVSH